jgi:hypothetical protein
MIEWVYKKSEDDVLRVTFKAYFTEMRIFGGQRDCVSVALPQSSKNGCFGHSVSTLR